MQMIDLEDDTFQAASQIDTFQRHIEEGGRVRHVRDDVVTLDLSDGSYTTINLRPVQHWLTALRALT